MASKCILLLQGPLQSEPVKAVLSDMPEVHLAGEVPTLGEAVEVLRRGEVHAVVVDGRLLGRNGADLIGRLRAVQPWLRVIVVSESDCDADLIDALRAGANGYIREDACAALLRTSLQTAWEGGVTVSAGLLRSVLEGIDGDGSQPPPGLTAREREVLLLLGQGYNNRDMAARLNIAVVTVKKHVQSVMTKLAVSDRTQAALLARKLRLGALPPPIN